MTDERKDFIEGLRRYDNTQKEQEKVAREIIKREILTILQKYDSIKLKADILEDEVIKSLGIQHNKEQVKECIEQILDSENSKYMMDTNNGYIIQRDITLELGQITDPQKRYQEGRNRRAKEKLQSFVETLETYVSILSYKKVKVTEANLRRIFSEEDLEKNKRWIDLAVDKVLKNHNIER